MANIFHQKLICAFLTTASLVAGLTKAAEAPQKLTNGATVYSQELQRCIMNAMKGNSPADSRTFTVKDSGTKAIDAQAQSINSSKIKNVTSPVISDSQNSGEGKSQSTYQVYATHPSGRPSGAINEIRACMNSL